jgi:hypothetical protein
VRTILCPTPESEWLLAGTTQHLPGTVFWCDPALMACGTQEQQSAWAQIDCIGEPMIVAVPEPSGMLVAGLVLLAVLKRCRP